MFLKNFHLIDVLLNFYSTEKINVTAYIKKVDKYYGKSDNQQSSTKQGGNII
jgi:hypothetical protein